MFGRSYAAPLLLANAGKSAMKVLVSARPELGDWITFTPDFGFIQVSGQGSLMGSPAASLLCAIIVAAMAKQA
jgi:hypothetical protein